MKKHITVALFIAVLAGVYQTGCNEDKNESSPITTMRTTMFEGVQGSCTNGGVKVEVLVDGTVDDAQTQYICNGAQGATGNDGQSGQNGTNANVLTTAFDDAQGICTDGGIKVEVLVDGVVQEDQTQYICNGAKGQDGQDGNDGQNGLDGHNVLVITSDEVGENCANSGIRVDSGLDENDNGTLDADEILNTRYVCDGAKGDNGEDGTNGANASILTTAFDDAQGSCTNGGIKVEVLIDGVVKNDQTQYICNGANGNDGQDGQDGTNGTNAIIQTIAFEGKQGSCTNGGVKVEVLVDGVVQSAQTQYLCNGTNGQNGQNGQDGQNGHNALVTTSSDVGSNCANGGTRMDFGLDANDNNLLDNAEILSTRYVCNGADGQNGQDGTNGTNASIKTTSFTGAQNGCSNGGIKVEVLVDGVVQTAQTRYICNGTNGNDGQDGKDGQNGHNALVAIANADAAHCANGGTRMDFGLDTNNNGILNTAEVLSTRYVCNGADGQDGQNGQDGTNGTNASIKTTSFTGAQNGCTNGGVKVEVLINNVVQTAQTQYICDGTNGQDGQDGQDGQNGHNALVATSNDVGSHCTNGGIRVDVGLDENDNGTLDVGEISSTQYICNGTSGGNPCAVGKWFDGDACRPDDAEHCRGVDCTTAVSHWGDGICTESGQCQVTACNGDTHLYDDGTSTVCEDNTSEHCGSHTINCGEGSECVNGACSGGIIQNCNGVMTDVLTDIDNCGTCGNACAYGLDCITGRCLGNANCSGTTHDTKTDLDHCGECNHRCSDGTTCVLGECVVAPGPAYCGSQTVQLNTVEHCASCDPCDDGLLCQNNQCIEGQGQMICSGIIIDSRSDSANCGSCGHVCNAGFECVNSSCKRITDFSSTTKITCNAQTVNPYNDRDNCAGCGIACADDYACHAGNCTIPSVGDIITFGNYEQDNDTTNGKEPVAWRVLAVNNTNQVLLLSEKILHTMIYNFNNTTTSWSASEVRKFLNGYNSYENGGFINAAFTTTEIERIVEVIVPAHTNPADTTISPGPATTDKLFLLSITEVYNYFKDKESRKADATNYAIQHAVKNNCLTCYKQWWLRTPGTHQYKVAVVQSDGYVYTTGQYVATEDYKIYHYYGVRPAMWIQY